MKKATATFPGPGGHRTRALVRRKPLGDDPYASGIESGAEAFKGTGRPDTGSDSVAIGLKADAWGGHLARDRVPTIE
ncbi:hypothetical protein ACWCPF_22385 [Streptomyces sp. NPDC001858]